MEYSNYVETRTSASALTGAELLAGSQGGNPRKWSINDIIALVGVAVGIGSSSQSSPAFNFQKYKQYVMTLRNVGSPKTVTHVNDENLKQYWLTVEITNVAGVITFPSNYKMSDSRWQVSGTTDKKWSPDFTGIYSGWAVWDGIDSFNLTLSYSPFGNATGGGGGSDGFDDYAFDFELTS